MGFFVSRDLCQSQDGFAITVALSVCQAALHVLHVFPDLTLKTTMRIRTVVPILKVRKLRPREMK